MENFIAVMILTGIAIGIFGIPIALSVIIAIVKRKRRKRAIQQQEDILQELKRLNKKTE